MPRLPRTDLEIYPLNLGGNTFGWTSDKETSFAVLDAFAEAGGNFIDTADSYSAWIPGNVGGESETILGEWMAARGNRADVVIATKVGALGSRKGLARDNVDAAVDESLARLKTDYIDLYYAHYDDEAVSIADQVRTFHDLVASGRIRHVALSNHSPARMREFFETARRENLTLPVAIQPLYNLVARRSFEQDYAPIAREFDAAVFPYYALASGFLTGKYRNESDLEGRDRSAGVKDYLNADGLGVVDALVEVADAHEAAPSTVALAWLLAKGITAPIASVSRPEQLPALLAATRLTLSAEQVAKLDAASQPFA